MESFWLMLKRGYVGVFHRICARRGADGPRTRGDPKLVRAVVKRLRRKLEDEAASPAYILNARAVGYRMHGPGDL